MINHNDPDRGKALADSGRYLAGSAGSPGSAGSERGLPEPSWMKSVITSSGTSASCMMATSTS